MRIEIRLAGTGGQGMILAGVVLAEASGVHEGRQVVQTQSYGPEARGGASKSDVIISDEEICYPKARKLDVLACLSQGSADAYVKDLKPGGKLITDSTFVHSCSRTDAVCVPITEATRAKFGRDVFANIVMLGAIASVAGVVALDSLKRAVTSRVPPATRDSNLAALELGYALGQDATQHASGSSIAK
jgi:2-oxoglutarate ferredoxin oxidoreductase subunit gamma